MFSKMASTSGSEHCSLECVNVSSKPWHLTFFTQDKQVFLWKKGSRMKLTNGVSSGPVHKREYFNSHCYNTTILASYID